MSPGHAAPSARPPSPGDVWGPGASHAAPGRGKLAALVVGVVVLVGALVGGLVLLTTHRTASAAITSPTEANSKLYAAAVDSGSFHYVSDSSGVVGGRAVTGTQSGDVGQGQGVQYMTSAIGDFEVIVVGSAAYMKANLQMLENMLGYSPSVAAPYVDRWIAFVPSDSLYKSVAADVTSETTWDNSSASPLDGLPQTPVSVSGLFTLNGGSVQTVRYALDGTNAASNARYRGTESITFAATGPHLPRTATEQLSGTVGQQASTSSNRTTFSNWGEPVDVKAPTTSIPYSTLPGATTTA